MTRPIAYTLTRCVVCHSADARVVAGRDEFSAELELLWEFHTRRLAAGVPVERLRDRVAFSQDPPWRLVRCTSCGLLYRNPVEAPRALRTAYADDAVDVRVLRELHDAQVPVARSQLERLLERGATGGAGLEVGSYAGAFLSATQHSPWRFEGLDVNARVNDFVRSLGHTVHDGDLETFAPDRLFDAVAIWNTFDQLPDPRSALLAVKRLLRPGGVLALRVPNGECYADWRSHLFSSSQFQRELSVRVLAHNNLLSFPYRFGFTPESLSRLVADAGCETVHVHRDSLVPVTDQWTKRWASLEARAVRRWSRRWSPWFELYARTP